MSIHPTIGSFAELAARDISGFVEDGGGHEEGLDDDNGGGGGAKTMCPSERIPSGTCVFTQAGHDGFGHQLEGTLSCLATSMVVPGVKYVHTPFATYGVAHGTVEADRMRMVSSGFSSGVEFGSIVSTTSPRRSHLPTVHSSNWRAGEEHGCASEAGHLC